MILTFLSGPLQIPYISNTIMWKAMMKDIGKSQKLDRELSLPELVSLIRGHKESAQSNSTAHMSLGKVSSPTVTGCEEVQMKVETDLQPSNETGVLIIVLALSLCVTVIIVTVGAGFIILRTVQWIQCLMECLVFTFLDIVRCYFDPTW